ncbi:hypothetical protein [Mesorhizobium sp.]
MLGAVGDGLVDVGAAAKLRAQLHVDWIAEFLGKVDDSRIGTPVSVHAAGLFCPLKVI